MSVEDIFTIIINHMRVGIELHRQFMLAYDFLSLKGYKKCQEYHWKEETNNYETVRHYYMENYYKLIGEEATPVSGVLPLTWYKYTKMDVDNNTRRNSIKEFTRKWVEWEKETEALFAAQCKELLNLNEVAAAKFIEKYVKEVSKELRQASHMMIYLETINYDMIEIVRDQEDYFNQYQKKLHKER